MCIFAAKIYNLYLMNIKKVIKEKGWTFERLAAQMTNKDGSLGVSQATVSQIVSGNPTLDKLQAIAKIIGVSVSELLSDEDEQSSTKIICPHCGKSINIKTEKL